jgi:hypothetical protein
MRARTLNLRGATKVKLNRGKVSATNAAKECAQTNDARRMPLEVKENDPHRISREPSLQGFDKGFSQLCL